MTNNKQQTAIEWLYCNLFPKHLDGFSDREWIKIDLAFKIAKEMEKEQIENGWYDGYLYEGRMPDHECVADTYYKKTYGGNK
jgi:hypothetical protein